MAGQQLAIAVPRITIALSGGYRITSRSGDWKRCCHRAAGAMGNQNRFTRTRYYAPGVVADVGVSAPDNRAHAGWRHRKAAAAIGRAG